MTAGGMHLLIEFRGCRFSVINNLSSLESHLKRAAVMAHCTILQSYFHEFEPQGITGFIALAESHISIHTWPEHNYAAIDIFMCGNKDPYVALRYLLDAFKPVHHNVKEIHRG